MNEQHYDVVVLGRSVGALVTAALLARRDFRVLVLGQGARPPSYRLGRHVLRRSAFTLLAATSPAFRRVLGELAQTQAFRRRARPLDPMLDLLLPDRRLELPPDIELFTREIDREFPEVRRVVDDLYADLARVNAAADAAFERDAVWPPGTFWERRETGRLAATLPYAREEPGRDLLGELPALHPYRDVAAILARFGTDLDGPLPAFALARLHGAFTRGLYAFDRGEDELEELLLERIAAYGSTLRLGDRATRIVVRTAGVAAVVIDGDLAPTGATFVVSDGTGEDVAALAGGEGIVARAQREWPRIERTTGRFVVNVVVRREGLPSPLGREAILLRAPPARGAPLHLVRLDPSAEPDAPPEAAGEALLVTELLVPLSPPAAASTAELREAVVATLESHFPFLREHLVAIDSPNDGRPAWLFDAHGWRGRRDVERRELVRGSTPAEPMAAVFTVTPPGWLGLGGEPVRGPVPRTFLVGRTVLPALGQEGQLIAAWGAARIITRTDRHKERMRRAMWSKVEIG